MFTLNVDDWCDLGDAQGGLVLVLCLMEEDDVVVQWTWEVENDVIGLILGTRMLPRSNKWLDKLVCKIMICVSSWFMYDFSVIC